MVQMAGSARTGRCFTLSASAMIWQRIPLKKSAGQADTQMRAAPFRAQVYCHRGRPATSTAMQASPRNTRHRTCWHLAADQVSTVKQGRATYAPRPNPRMVSQTKINRIRASMAKLALPQHRKQQGRRPVTQPAPLPDPSRHSPVRVVAAISHWKINSCFGRPACSWRSRASWRAAWHPLPRFASRR